MRAKSTPKRKRVPVSQRALVARIRRKLAKDGEYLKANRSSDCPELGNWYCIGANNFVTSAHEDLEQLGREIDCLKDFETLITPA